MKGAQKKVLELLEKNGVVDNWSMIDQRITTRLSSIIHRLREAGYSIETEVLDNKNCVYRFNGMREGLV